MARSVSLRPLLVVCAGLTIVALAAAQTRRPMTIVDVAEIPRLLDPQLSPDGQSVIYILNRADWKANRAIGHLWRQAVAGGAAVQLTSGESGEMPGARWSPDSKRILFLANRGSGVQIHILPADGGEAKPLTKHATSVSQPAWAPDGSAIYFLAGDAPTPEERERQRLGDDVYAFDEDYRHRHLWRVDVATGAEHKVTAGDWSVTAYRISRDGRQIVLHRAPTPLVADSFRSEIWIIDAGGENPRALTTNSIEEVEAELSPDRTQVAFLAEANGRFEPYYTSTLFVVPAAGGTPQRLLPDFPYSIERASWTPDGAGILAVGNMGVHSEVFRIDVAARRARPLTDGQHQVQGWSVAPASGRMVFQFDEPTRIGDVWTLAVEGGTPARVTGIYDSLDRDFQLPRQEKVSWKGTDGTSVEGILFLPAGYETGRRYPVVVQLHGGPSESDKFGWGPGVIVNYVPVLTAKGFVVFRPNYRGSSGYGDAFLRDVVGGYFKNMHLDVMAGVDDLIRRAIADPDRLAVMGWSAGGHLTNKLITFTDRFKAASSTAGAANWVSMFAQTDTRESRSLWFGGTPWQAGAPIESYWDNSPLKDAARVKTPTLFVAGEQDARVPMMQAVEMYRALKANGVTTKLLVAPREGHQWTPELRHQIYKANAELEWFERHVNGRAHVWERAPGDRAAAPKLP